ncbi:MOSC domain-containing protein [bacterium]|nr:MOSC domain-containing protein [bacterium]
MHLGQLAQITIYPVKSSAGLNLTQTQIEPRGLRFDRRWMIVAAATGHFLSARETPQLLQLLVQPSEQGLHLQAPGLDLQVATPAPDGQRQVSVWDDELSARLADSETNNRLSDWLGQAVQLVYMAPENQRAIDPRYATAAAQSVSFADGYPILLLSAASLSELNRRLLEKGRGALSMARFRPNLVVDTALAAHAEDAWKRIQIGAAEFAVVKPCVRCVLTTIDPDTLQREPDNEPLKTLIEYRRSPKGVTFGMNLIPLNQAELALGMSVVRLA